MKQSRALGTEIMAQI